MARSVLTLILAGGEGERLSILSQVRAKPGVPFGGKYRIIDFSLSNVVNSGLTDVGILTQYAPRSLIDHIGVVVKDLDKGLDLWKTVFSYLQTTQPVENARQSVRVVFLEKAGSSRIKLVAPTGPLSSVAAMATRGGGLHHLFFPGTRRGGHWGIGGRFLFVLRNCHLRKVSFTLRFVTEGTVVRRLSALSAFRVTDRDYVT